MFYTENWIKEYTNECNEWTNECNEWDHWVEDIENCEFPDQYIMIDSKIICVNNILDQKHLIKFQENKQMTKKRENLRENLRENQRVKENQRVNQRERIWTNIEIEQINKKKRDQAKRDFEIDEWTRTQVYNDCYFIDIEKEEDIECIKKKEVFEYFTEIIQTTYLFISAIRYL